MSNQHETTCETCGELIIFNYETYTEAEGRFVETEFPTIDERDCKCEFTAKDENFLTEKAVKEINESYGCYY